MLPIPAEELNGSGTLGPYWTFYRAVVAEQLSRWLPAEPLRRTRPVMGPRTLGRPGRQSRAPGDRAARLPPPDGRPAALHDAGRVSQVRADDLRFLPDRAWTRCSPRSARCRWSSWPSRR